MTDTSEHLRMAKALSKLLDSKWSILGFRFGLDPVFDLIPGIGTIIPTALSLYIVWIAYECKLPKFQLVRMMIYIILDGLVGSIPILGTFVDAIFKANEKNVRIIEQYITEDGVVLRR